MTEIMPCKICGQPPDVKPSGSFFGWHIMCHHADETVEVEADDEDSAVRFWNEINSADKPRAASQRKPSLPESK